MHDLTELHMYTTDMVNSYCKIPVIQVNMSLHF